MDTPLQGTPPVRWGRISGLFRSAPGQPQIQPQDSEMEGGDPMTVIRIPRWVLPVVGSGVLASITWMSHLTTQLNEVQQTQARGEYLFDSHDELREDVKSYMGELNDVKSILVRIESRLQYGGGNVSSAASFPEPEPPKKKK